MTTMDSGHEDWKVINSKLETSASAAFIAMILFAALAAFNVVHWGLWIAPLGAAFGVLVSNGMQLKKLESEHSD